MHKLVLMALLLAGAPGYATQQIKETFIVEGKSIGIDSKPLEYLYSYEQIHVMLASKGWCSANWRGYKGTWEIKDKTLFLKTLVKGACAKKPPQVDPVLFFGEEEYPMKAAWFNGKIQVRLTENVYESCKAADGSDQTTGYEFDAIVYEFAAGELVYKNKETIKQRWKDPDLVCFKS